VYKTIALAYLIIKGDVNMHSKAKGNIGEAAVALDLMKKGWSVFTEMGDLSYVDLIALKDERIVRLQVKTIWETQDKLTIGTRSMGPGYKYHYTEKDIDVMVGYAADKDVVIYVPIKTIIETGTSVTLRFEPTKNRQTKGVRFVKDFLEL